MTVGDVEIAREPSKCKSTVAPALWVAGPALIVASTFHFALGHRSDYLGHFAAGFGGTIIATMLLLAACFRARSAIPSLIALACLASIAFGAVLEASIFRIGRFDEVDFCNQSLGAVLAALVALRMNRSDFIATPVLAKGIAIGVAFIVGGFWFAFK